MMSSGIILLPCPFCGSNQVAIGSKLEAFAYNKGTGYFVNCADCLASTNHLVSECMAETKEEAAAAWNTRNKEAVIEVPDPNNPGEKIVKQN